MSTPHGPLALVVNGRRGQLRERPVGAAVAVLDRLGVEHRVLRTRYAGHATELARIAVQDGARFVVAVGGDGTVHEVVNGLVDAERGEAIAAGLVLGVVPAGSGCDFVRTFGLDVPTARLVERHLVTGTTMPLDLGRVRYVDRDGNEVVRVFANIAEVGFGADVVRTAARLPEALGSGRYLASVLLRTARLRAVETTVTVGHTSTTEPMTEVVVANGQFFGGGFKIAPRALTDDGVLNVQTWRGGRAELLANLPRARSGEHLSTADVREWQSAVAEVDAVRPLAVEADGELLGRTPASFDVLPEVLRLSV